ncbi:hypothetical protein D9M72_596130 [compost metagenome]
MTLSDEIKKTAIRKRLYAKNTFIAEALHYLQRIIGRLIVDNAGLDALLIEVPETTSEISLFVTDAQQCHYTHLKSNPPCQ